MTIELFVKQLTDLIIGWPLMIFVVAVSLMYTVVLRGIQFRYFFTAFKATLFPSQKEVAKAGELSSFHAFINTINSNLGNGSIAGMATAIYIGGPGSAFWVIVFGVILMAVRFAEVYVSSLYARGADGVGGPMLYLRDVVGGKYLSYAYGICAIFFGLLSGNAMQANSIQVSLSTTCGIAPWISATALFCFILYILFGGADRIVKISMTIVPVKVFVFVVSSLWVLIYHYQNLFNALTLITKSAFGLPAFGGAVLGFSLQQIIGSGMTRSIFATESGTGSAAILFGSASASEGIKNGMMGMVSTFISTLVCFIVGLCIVVSGVWNSGANSTALTIAAFETAFGVAGSWIVTFLAVTFGFGVLVAYAFVGRSIWFFLTKNRYNYAFIVLYSLCTFFGALASILIVWDLCTIAVGITLAINLFGLLMLMPKVKRNALPQLESFKA